ncbi:MAG: DNA polymerase III subunit beta [Candidatus Poribacteria bacterium]
MRYAMQTLRGAVSGKTTLPILENVLLDCRSDTIEMSATDLEVGIRTIAYGDVEEPGILTIPARKLTEVTRELPNEDVTLTVSDGDQVLIECADVTYLMFGLPARDFPTIPELGDSYFTLDAVAVGRMIDSVRTAVSTEASRFSLNGVFIDVSPDWLRMVATDSRRLAIANLDVSGLVEGRRSAILPTRAAEGVLRSFVDVEEIRLALMENQAVFSDGEITLSGRLINGEFPAYERIIPQDNPIHVVTDREAFLTAVRRVSLFSDPKTLSVRLDISDQGITLSARSEDFGEAREAISADARERIAVGFNAKFLTDALSSMDSERVRMELKGPLDATVFRPVDGDDYAHLIMPMRLD